MLTVHGKNGKIYEVNNGLGLGIRQHDDVMLSWGLSRTTHIDFSIDAGDFAVVVLEIPSGMKLHHAENRSVEVYNSPVDVKIIPNWLGTLPAIVETMPIFNQKGAVLDPTVKGIFTFRGTNIATDPIAPTRAQIIDHVILRATTGQGQRASSKDLFNSVTGRYYYEGFHVALFENLGNAVAEVRYSYNWHEQEA